LQRAVTFAQILASYDKERRNGTQNVVVSDLSGETIDDGKGAKVRITVDNARSGAIELDMTVLPADAEDHGFVLEGLSQP
jgi:hypothetical protein